MATMGSLAMDVAAGVDVTGRGLDPQDLTRRGLAE